MQGSGGIRTAELVLALSAASDLTMGQPTEHGLGSALLALALAAASGATLQECDDTYYTALLRWSGCTGNAHETAALFGDDITSRAALLQLDPTSAPALAAYLRRYGSVAEGADPTGDGPRRLLPEVFSPLVTAHCEVAQRLAEQLVGSPGVRAALGQIFERWDGTGIPAGTPGPRLALPAQIAVLAGDMEVLTRSHGLPGALGAIRHGAGSVYSPRLVSCFLGWRPSG